MASKVVDLANLTTSGSAEILSNGIEKPVGMNGFVDKKGQDDARSEVTMSMVDAPPDRAMSTTSAVPRFVREAALNKETLLGPRRPQPHKIWKKKYVKLLVVGDSGLGKTTLIQTLLTTPGERLNVHDGSSTPMAQFKADPDSLLSTVSWKDEEDRTVWVFQIQDTPGYGDDLFIWNHINMVLEYVENQNQAWLALEQSRHRQVELGQALDPRVDLVLYCLPPHRLRAVDLRYMFELSRAVPVLPVVTKADTMTIKEATVFRQEVFTRLLNPNLPHLTSKINVFEFERDTLMRAGVLDAITGRNFPFLVVASNDVNVELDGADPPVYWPERAYTWGTAEAFNTTHSDLLILRALLLKEALEEIALDKRVRYEKWRRRTLSQPRPLAWLLKAALFTVAPIALALHAGHRGYGVKDLPKVAKHTRRFLHSSLESLSKNLSDSPAPAPAPKPKLTPPAPAPAPAAAAPPPPPPPPVEPPVEAPPPPPAPAPAPAPAPEPAKKSQGWF